MGLFGRIREGLSKTTQQFVERFNQAVGTAEAEERRSRPVDVDTIEARASAFLPIVSTKSSSIAPKPQQMQSRNERLKTSKERRLTAIGGGARRVDQTWSAAGFSTSLTPDSTTGTAGAPRRRAMMCASQ